MNILEVVQNCPKEESNISSFIALFLFLTIILIILLGVTEKDDE